MKPREAKNAIADERALNEEALKRSERELKLIVNTIPALAWSARPDGSGEFFNQYYLDYAGLSAEQSSDWERRFNMSDNSKSDQIDRSRRKFLKTSGTTAAAGVISAYLPAHATGEQTSKSEVSRPAIDGAVPITLRINGKDHKLKIDPRTTLLDCIRETVALTGTKKGCDHGQCGACTVHVNGKRVLSCLNLALMHDGHEITTIEGLGTPDALHPMQAAFLATDGYQCGYCTSGQIMSAVALLNEPCGPDDAAVKELMSGNICRCGAYANIVAAIQQVRKTG